MVSSTTVSSHTKSTIRISNAGKEKKSTCRNGGSTGSRRIFSPVFKLQVLDSYRNDADCQGNQRATARKYGIHRRQIQKWLQMETNLCLSVQQSGVAAAAASLNLGSAARHGGVAATKRVAAVDDTVKSQPVVPLSTSLSDTKPKDECVAVSVVSSDTDEYVNVDEITDSEYDDETSTCSSSYEKSSNDTIAPLDLTCTASSVTTTLSKRRFFSSEFKRNVLNAFNHDNSCKGNQRATARKFGIHRRQVQKWLNRVDLIEPVTTECNDIAGDVCLDLSQPKRKLSSAEGPDVKLKSPSISPPQLTQESALCLVKKETKPEIPDIYLTPFPSPIEHSFVSSTPNYHHHVPEYPFGFYQPWSCCYATPVVPLVRPECIAIPKYSYMLDLKCDTSYVDIPVQYGFGDSVPSKWLKENPFFVHESPSIRVSDSYK